MGRNCFFVGKKEKEKPYKEVQCVLCACMHACMHTGRDVCVYVFTSHGRCSEFVHIAAGEANFCRSSCLVLIYFVHPIDEALNRRA